MHNVTGSCYIRLGDEKEEVQDVGCGETGLFVPKP